MKLIIDIDESDYYRIEHGFANEDDALLLEKIFKNGTPIYEEESKTGYWIYDKHKSNWYDSIYRCSCCGRTILISFDKKADVNLCRDYPYCHCGAKMEEEE